MKKTSFVLSVKHRSAFTLIELLVVISIIALLMAVMMPALSKVRKSAVALVCKTQLKDIGSAINIYAAENNGCFPDSQGLDSNGLTQAGGRWMTKIAPYYNVSNEYNDVIDNKGDNIYNYDLFRCPALKKAVKEYINSDQSTIAGSAGAAGIYGYNIYFTNSASGYGMKPNPRFGWRKVSSILSPSGLPLMADVSCEDPIAQDGNQAGHGMHLQGNWPHPKAYTEYDWKGGSMARHEYNYAGPAANHDGKTNYLFADGHTENKGIWDWDHNDGTDFHPRRNIKVNP